MRMLTTIAIALSAVAAHSGSGPRDGGVAATAVHVRAAGDAAARSWEQAYAIDPADSLYRVAREALNRG